MRFLWLSAHIICIFQDEIFEYQIRHNQYTEPVNLTRNYFYLMCHLGEILDRRLCSRQKRVMKFLSDLPYCTFLEIPLRSHQMRPLNVPSSALRPSVSFPPLDLVSLTTQRQLFIVLEQSQFLDSLKSYRGFLCIPK